MTSSITDESYDSPVFYRDATVTPVISICRPRYSSGSNEGDYGKKYLDRLISIGGYEIRVRGINLKSEWLESAPRAI